MSRDTMPHDRFIANSGIFKIPVGAVLQAMDELGRPVSMKELGDHLGLLTECYGFKCTDRDERGNCFNLSHKHFIRGPRGYASDALTRTVRNLRNFTLMVKLPFDGASGLQITYATCRDYEHGAQLQAEACQALLDEVPGHLHGELKYRRLRTALDGLLSVAEGAAGDGAA